MSENTLYYGDNLDILRCYIKDESVDLIYLDPPFKSNQDYNVLFAEQNGTRAAAQIKAFEDTWRWDEIAARAYEEIVIAGGRVANVMRSFRNFLGGNDMTAYLSMMAPRLVELRRILKTTGSIYLHCDTTASHYLKLLMDAVFGLVSFRNEIIWKRKYGKAGTFKRFGTCTDSILFYVKTDDALFHRQFRPNKPEYIEKFYRHVDEKGRRFRIDNLANPAERPHLMYEYKGYKPPEKGWAISLEKMKQFDREGRLHFPKDKSGRLARKRFLDELKGEQVQNLWDDIKMVGAQASERLGFPTQKPEALLERIIQASSNEDDVVLDPFCGCGTAVAVAQRLNRQWIGIDITHLAITLIKKRLFDTFGEEAKFKVLGEPVDLSGARELAKQNKFQFQWWALGLVNARPAEQKKGADQGIDGRRYFTDGKRRKTEEIIFSVKGGHTSVKDVRDLGWVVEREAAAMGVIITLEEPTRDMRKEVAGAGFYHSDYQDTKHPRLQIVTLEELMSGKKLDLPVLARIPATDMTFKKAPKSKAKRENQSLDFNK